MPATRHAHLESYDLDRLPTIDSKKSKKPVPCLTILVVVFGLCLIGLSIFAGIIHSKQSPSKDTYTCLSEDCVKTAARILSALNNTIDPCEDFYEFSCGGWQYNNPVPNGEIRWDPARQLAIQVYKNLQNILEDDSSATEGTPNSVVKAKILYKTCMDDEEEGLSSIHRTLSLVGLPSQVPEKWSGTQWYEQEARVRRTLGQNAFLNVEVTLDEKNSKYLLKIGKYSLETNQDIGGKNLAHWNYTKTLVKVFDPVADQNSTDPQFQHFTFIASLENLKYSKDEEFVTVVVNDATVPAHIQLFLKGYLKVLFEDSTVKLNLNEDRIRMDLTYLTELSVLLNKTDPLSVEKYLIWSVTSELTLLTSEFRDLHSEFYRDVLGEKLSSKRQYCCEYVQNNFGFALSYLYVQRHFQNFSSTKAIEMFEDIRKAFGSEVERLRWMDDETRLKTLGKLRAIEHFIGIPPFTPEEIDRLYSNLEVVEGDFLASNLRIKQAEVKKELERLRNKPGRTSWLPAIMVGAYYKPSFNQVVVPASILQLPFYGNGFEAIDYGAMGSILGHEVTHGFDSNGRRNDMFGNLNDWWTNASLQSFEKKAQCFVDQYNQYHMSATSNLTLDGSEALAENIADNGGIRAALSAFKLYMQRNPGSGRARLPGFTQYDATQMFFLGFAQNWCVTYTKGAEKLPLGDNHSPDQFRLLGTLSNSQEFADAWKCPAGSRMNPVNKCVLW